MGTHQLVPHSSVRLWISQQQSLPASTCSCEGELGVSSFGGRVPFLQRVGCLEAVSGGCYPPCVAVLFYP
eukprot:1157035-Pelagomonas_calceolata.AAC.9